MNPILFTSDTLHARELRDDEVPQLQALFDANPAYFETVNGRAPRPDEARTEFDELPPPHLGFTRRWVAGLFERDGALAGVAIVVSDLGAPGVWHVALFLLATRLHGTGAAAAGFAALDAWARAGGARWLRLAVVCGNTRAERFWSACGFVETRIRHGLDTGGRINDVRVMVKPLGDAGVDAYLERMPRDRPGAELP
jgi:GNAT superfamily N-acetyltransferase